MNTHNTTHASSTSSDADPARLEREVDRQRERIGGLVDALENKLSPGEMFERVLNYSKGGGREFVGNLGHTVKTNPVPALLTAAGLVWLYAGKDQTSHASYGRQAYVTGGGGSTGMPGAALHDSDDGDHTGIGDRLRGARDGMSDSMEHVRDRMGHARDRAGDMTHGAIDSVKQRSRQVNDGFQHMLEDNPLAVGAIGIAVGALLGAMLPTTHKEDELLGDTSDRLTDKAKTLAKQGYEQASEAGRELGKPRDDGGSRPGGDATGGSRSYAGTGGSGTSAGTGIGAPGPGTGSTGQGGAAGGSPGVF